MRYFYFLCALVACVITATTVTEKMQERIVRDCELIGALRIGDKAFTCTPPAKP